MDGLLFDGVPLAAVARMAGTPCWVISADTLRRRYRDLSRAMPEMAIHYAVKANDHLAVLDVLARAGAGADVVSGGELRRAVRAGIPGGRIVFSGVGKTRDELAMALVHGVAQINVESAEELLALACVAGQLGRTAPVALRVNPDIDAGTHEKISTGRAEDKFGIPVADVVPLYEAASRMPGVKAVGLAVHIGSQVFRMSAFGAAYRCLAELVVALRGRGLAVETVDCGGGLGISYAGEPACPPQAWAATIRGALGGLGLRLSVEPGRWLAGPAGVLLARVVRTRRAGRARPTLILDAAMNDLARPSLYGAWHGIVPVGARDLVADPVLTDIAGPVCESADVFARARSLPELADGAIVAIMDTGAYGAVMSSTYNARPLAAQVLIDGTLPGGTALIRAAQTAEDLWVGEIVPERTT